jgi:hypothetical protein
MTEVPLPELAAAAGRVDLDELADKIVARLGGSVISSAIPASVGEWLRAAVGDYPFQFSHLIPLNYGHYLSAVYHIGSDGAIRLEFLDEHGSWFWRGTFNPKEPDYAIT